MSRTSLNLFLWAAVSFEVMLWILLGTKSWKICWNLLGFSGVRSSHLRIKIMWGNTLDIITLLNPGNNNNNNNNCYAWGSQWDCDASNKWYCFTTEKQNNTHWGGWKAEIVTLMSYSVCTEFINWRKGDGHPYRQLGEGFSLTCSYSPKTNNCLAVQGTARSVVWRMLQCLCKKQ